MAVKVKKLEWQSTPLSVRFARFTALTVFGYYEVLEWSDGGCGGSFPADATDDSDVNFKEFRAASLDEAKAAAQADYERRILSAIEEE